MGKQILSSSTLGIALSTLVGAIGFYGGCPFWFTSSTTAIVFIATLLFTL